MRILFTGASSFSGFGFVQALAAGGHELVCPLRGSPEGYTGVRRQRVEQLKNHARLMPQTAFGTEPFLRLLREAGPWDLLCHHAAEVGNYKSAEFNPFLALENNTHNLRSVLETFRLHAGHTVVLTGTIFEPDEGVGEEPLRAFSPYGLSKGLTWQVFRFYCGQAPLPLRKFVMPNPFGPWEEPRFTAFLMNTWKEGGTVQVKSPDYIRDNIHLDLLSTVYARFATSGMSSPRSPGSQSISASLARINPSGYAETNRDFTLRVAREVRARTGWKCEVELLKQQDFSEPLRRTNLEPAAPLAPEWNEKASWDAFVEFYAQGAATAPQMRSGSDPRR